MTETSSATFGGRLLIGATGSAAIAMLPVYISALRSGFTGSVSVLMTHTAKEFLPAHTVALFADRVITGEPASTWPENNHAALAAEHDMLAVFPATANMLATVAAGGAPNMLCATILAAEFPVVFFPVMTAEMWKKPAVQRNVDRLRADGYHVNEPPWGSRYDVQAGRLVEGPMPPPPPAFVEAISAHMPR
jgi:phosphopantothenoylcysteine decarboxylase